MILYRHIVPIYSIIIIYQIIKYSQSHCRIVLYFIIVKLQYRTIEIRQIKFVLFTNQDLYWLCIINDDISSQYVHMDNSFETLDNNYNTPHGSWIFELGPIIA